MDYPPTHAPALGASVRPSHHGCSQAAAPGTRPSFSVSQAQHVGRRSEQPASPQGSVLGAFLVRP
eukprot:scaffold1837_cov336-Pinguiococcus_pyrenoidosus.AAC.2